MIILGLILFLVGLLLHFPYHHVVEIIGLILLIVGLVVLVLGYAGHPLGPRRHYY